MKCLIFIAIFALWPVSVFAPYAQYYKVKNATPTRDEIVSFVRLMAEEYGVDASIALEIAFAESSLNPFATNTNKNGSTDKGLFQINSIHGIDDNCRMDYKCNTKWAIKTMATVGTTPWYSSEHKWNK